MDLDQLKGFYYAAKLKSFTEAAAKLYLTQPAISLQVKALEKEVGEKLFDRAGRTIRLTHAGEILYRHVEDLVGKADEIRQVIQDIKSVGVGRLLLGASDTTSMYFLPELLKTFRTMHPNVELAIDSHFSKNVVQRVLDREVDLGIITLPSDDSRLDVVPLFSHRLVAIVHEGHPFRRFKSLKVSDLSNQPLILLGKQSVTRSRIEQYLSRCRKAPRVVLELSNFEIIKHYVAHGLGISLVPEKAVEQPLPGLCVIPLRQKLRLEVGAVYRNGRTLSHSTAAFLEMAASHFARAAVSVAAAPQRMSLSHSGPSGPSRN